LIHVTVESAASQAEEAGMQIVVRGRGLDPSAKFRTAVEHRLSRIDRFGVPVDTVDVEVTLEPNPRQAERAAKVEISLHGSGRAIRAEAAASDKGAALELAADHLEERLRRHTERRRVSKHGKHLPPMPAPIDVFEEPAPVVEVDPYPVPEDSAVLVAGPVVVREKTHASRPMTVAEAVDALELVDHDFYLFFDTDTSKPSVVYRRRGFDYGLIRLDHSETA
jgi:ribosomal subunit interface protein